MDIGVHIPNSDDGADPIEIAKAAEKLGFESIFVPEHSHLPVSLTSNFPGADPMGREYYRMMDPFVTLGAIASVTTRLGLGTGICVVTEHHPIMLAKTVATLDHLSNGRVLFGIGQGWADQELANVGTDPKHKVGIMGERVRAMQEMWTKDQAEFHGKYVDFDPLYSWPKPVRRPYPPILVGGMGPSVLKRTVAYGDGWYPVHGKEPFGEISVRIAELQQLAAEGRRAPMSVSLGTKRDDHFDAYAEGGVTRMIYRLPAGPTELVLDRMADIANKGRHYVR